MERAAVGVITAMKNGGTRESGASRATLGKSLGHVGDSCAVTCNRTVPCKRVRTHMSDSEPLASPLDAREDDRLQQDYLSTAGTGQTALRGGALRLGGYLIGILATTVSSAMLFRHLGVIVTGQYVTALSLVAMISAFSDLGLTAVGIREISRLDESDRWGLAQDLLGLKLTLTIVGGLIVTCIAWFAYSTTLATGVALSVIGLAFSATQDNYALALVVELRFGWIAALDLTRNVLTALATMTLVLLGARLVPFLGISIPVCLVVMVATAIVVMRGRPLLPSFNVHRWKRFAASMLPYSAAVAASLLYYRVSILLVSAIASGAQLGYFSMSYRVIDVLTVVPNLLVSSAFPILARSAQDNHARFDFATRKVFEISLLVGAWIAVSVATAAPLAIDIIGGNSFRPASQVLAFQGIGLGAMFVNVAGGYGLLSLGRYRTILAINSSSLVLNIVIVSILTSADGARGAAIGTGITEIVVAVVQAWLFSRSGHSLRPSISMLPRVLVTTAVALIPLTLTGVPTLTRLAISTVSFVVVAAVTRAIPAEVLSLLPGQRLLAYLRLTGHR